MHPIFEVTSSDIRQLNDEQARELVARLCRADLRRQSAGTDSVTWGGDQRAKDGGVDVRVDISPAIGISGYIPRDATAYQVKAESFAQAKVPGEMAPKGVLRHAVVELATCSGAYVIVSTKDNCSDSALKNRKKAMADCLAKYGLADRVHLDFYDSRKIADWAGDHPAVLVWLRSVLGKPIQGWRPYDAWAYRETSIESEYLLDDKIKVFVQNSDEAISVVVAIQRLRKELTAIGASARLVGLSGVGKTRLVQALFDSRIQASAVALNPEAVVYTDISDNPMPQPTAMLEALSQEGADVVVVVDNCGQDIHQKLTEIVKRPGSKIRLVTVEYDIRDDLPDSTVCYKLEGSTGEVITELLKHRYQNVSDVDIQTIVEFSDGNARVAFALASTSAAKGELAQLRDEALFKRLFIQKHTESNELQRCAEAASLLYSFDFEGSDEQSELAILASVAEVTVQTFYVNVSELKRRGLVQERGKWRAVLPHAISNRLAIKAIQSNPSTLLIGRLVDNASDRIALSFTRRLGYLHESTYAQRIVAEWLKPEGLLGNVASLSLIQRQMFENVSPVNQPAALNALIRATSIPNFVSLSNSNRTDAARLLRSLAYEPELFHNAASALLTFALVESDGNRTDSTRDILQSLFYCHLSGTLAGPDQRASFVRELAFSADPEQTKLALLLLGAALESHHFSSFHNFEFGALKRGYGWHPRTDLEVQAWYGLFIEIAVDLGKTTTAASADARALLGGAFRGLWCYAGMTSALATAAAELVRFDGWPDGWIGIRNTLNLDKAQLSPVSIRGLISLEKQLAPRTLQEKIQARVLSRGALGGSLDDFDPDDPADSYVKGQEEATALGEAAARDADALAVLTPFISTKHSTDKVWSFGLGVGRASAAVRQILDRLRALIAAPPSDGFELQFIRGVIKGWAQTKPDDASNFLDKAIEDAVWGAIFPSLQLAVPLDENGFERLIKSLDVGLAKCWQYQYLGSGRATEPLTVEQVGRLLLLLAKKPSGGLPAAIDVLYMVIHGASGKDQEYKAELRAYCLAFVGEMNWDWIDFGNQNFCYHLVQVIEFGLESPDPYDIAAKTVSRLIQMERFSAGEFVRRLGDVLSPFFKKCPFETLDAVYSKDEDTAVMRSVTIWLDRHEETAIGSVPDDSLIEWCKVSLVDRCCFAAKTCKLFERKNPGQSGEDVEIGISSIAKRLLALAPDQEKILKTLEPRFFPTSWSGSLATIMRQRIQYVDQLNPTGDAVLAQLIQDLKARLSEKTERFDSDEQARERRQTATFE